MEVIINGVRYVPAAGQQVVAKAQPAANQRPVTAGSLVVSIVKALAKKGVSTDIKKVTNKLAVARRLAGVQVYQDLLVKQDPAAKASGKEPKVMRYTDADAKTIENYFVANHTTLGI